MRRDRPRRVLYGNALNGVAWRQGATKESEGLQPAGTRLDFETGVYHISDEVRNLRRLGQQVGQSS